MGPRDAFAKAVAIRRELGWRVLFWRTLGWVGIRRLVLFRRGVEASKRDRPLNGSVVFGRLEGDALDEFLDVRPDADRAELELRREAGDTCHVARFDGRIVSTRWTSTREVRIGYLDYRSPLAPGQAYLYDAYTAPLFRRRGIAGALTRHIIAFLHQQGVREMLSAADPANPAGNGFNHSDGKPIATLVGLGRRRRRVLTLRPPRRPRGSRA